MRLFLAINLDESTRAAVHAAAAPLREAAPQLAWVAEQGLHLTLKFLGEQPAQAVPRIVAAMDAAAVAHAALPTALGDFGAFPNFRRPGVVWIGMDNEPRLELIHHDVETACDALGYPLDARPFRPHVTLARVRHPLGVEPSRALSRAARAGAGASFSIVIRSIDLMCSTLRPEGAAYELLHASPFRES
ncbi:MAG: RNA 2',3'-cyclic phosphodiesterase [Gemmatimonadaceae bacterium]